MIRVIGVDPSSPAGIVALSQTGELLRVEQVNRKSVTKVRYLGATWALFTIELRTVLLGIVETGDVLAYEDVRRHAGTDAAHAYGRALGVLEEVAWLREARLVKVGVGAAKRTATGYGRAEKDAMISAARDKWGDLEWSEHTADAAWIAETARRGEE